VAVLDANKKKFCVQIAQLFKDGQLSEEKFKKLYAGSKCGQSVSSEISSSYWDGFWKGAHDGHIQTSYSALNVLTLGFIGLEDMPMKYGWFYDPDLPELEYSKYAGRGAGTALTLAMGAGGGAAIGRFGAARYGTWHYTSATGVRGIVASGRILPSANGLVYSSWLPPWFVTRGGSVLLGLGPRSVQFAVRVYGTSNQWYPFTRSIRGPFVLLGG